ncbi:MAG: hypothetical protein M3R70_12585 [Actinomycetota bacterium]|nr:hypothetical protein [Actinomycetota bacterium]
MLIILSLVIGLPVLIASTRSAHATKPTIRIAHRSPLVIRGRHFKAAERVTVKVVTRATRVRRTQATPDGSFGASFGDVPADRCSSFRVRAIGSRGSVAFIKLPQPLCAPAGAP